VTSNLDTIELSISGFGDAGCEAFRRGWAQCSWSWPSPLRD